MTTQTIASQQNETCGECDKEIKAGEEFELLWWGASCKECAEKEDTNQDPSSY